MKTFAEMLPTATAEMREFVMAYERDMVKARDADPNTATPFELLLATPPAKGPASVDGSFGDDPDDHAFAITWDKPLPFNTGDRVRVVKIEEVQK